MSNNQNLTAEQRIAQLEAMLAASQAETLAAKARAATRSQRSLSAKVSQKGAVSVYGLNARFPVTLYAQQWAKLEAFMPELKAFLAENQGMLATKEAAE